MRGFRIKRGRGFTLAEMMLTLGLVVLVYTIVSTILVQIARYVRAGREVAKDRHQMLRSVEGLRYQLRSLHYPASAVALNGERSPVAGRDNIRFLTTNGRKHKGVVEVAYQIDDYVDPKDPTNNAPALYYREFPFHRRELRTLVPNSEAEWTVFLENVEGFELEYLSSGQSWQREWEQAQPPKRIRLRIKRGGVPGDKIVFDVTPGVAAGRW